MRALKAIGIFLTVSTAMVLVFELVVSEPVVMEIGRRPTDVTGAVRGAIALVASSLATWLYVRRNPNRSLHSMFSAGAAGLTPYVLGRMFSAGAAGLTPTHSIPEQGLPIRRKPDPNEKPFGGGCREDKRSTSRLMRAIGPGSWEVRASRSNARRCCRSTVGPADGSIPGG